MLAGDPLLHIGMYNSSQVADVQRALNTKLGMSLDVDGDFGPMTEQAVEQFQASQGLVVDGVVGPNTWNALMVVSPITMPTNESAPTGVPRYGPALGPVPIPAVPLPWFTWIGIVILGYYWFTEKK